MESKDLRVGNSIYQNEDLVFVTTWRLKLIELKCVDYKPIPLTEEWLKKFCFKKEKSDIPTFSKVFGRFIEDDYEHCLIINLDADEIFYTVINGVKLILKHVHQLQNLYFAFTGEELISKEYWRGINN